MAREASPLTQAIRNLCEQTKGAITHSEARPKLAKLNFEIAPEPDPSMNDDVKLFEGKFKEVCDGYDFDPKNEAHVKDMHGKTFEALGWTPHKGRAVVREIAGRTAFKNERNSFDVCKYNWRQSAGTTSEKPTGKNVPPDPKAKTAAKVARTTRSTAAPAVIKPQPKHPAAAAAKAKANGKTVAHDLKAETEALAYVEANGGVSALTAKLDGMVKEIAAKQAEADALKAKLDMVNALKARLQAA
jgi:hypothetical protein